MEANKEKRELPLRWVSSKLGEITNIKYGKGLPTSKFIEKGFPVFGANGIIGYYNEYLYEEEQLLISCRGANSGKINISPKFCYVTNNSLIIDFPLCQKQLRKTLFYALQIVDKSKLITGTAQPQVTINNAVELEIHLPPLPEQHQIVTKIEELFSELDNGIENLKKAREQLKTYRQAVLKYAFEGKLTNLVQNNELPKSWKTKKLGESLDIVSGNTPKGVNDIQSLGEIPFYKVGDMNTHGNEVYMKKANLNLTQEEVNSLRVKLFPKGTVIFPKRGGAILTNKKRILSSFSGFDLNLMGAIPNENIDGLYLYYWFQKLNLSKIYDGSNVPQINKKNIAPLDIPIPPIDEQQAIVSEIESRLSVCDKIEQTIEDSLKKAEALRQSILKKAFAGELTRDWRTKNPELISGENSAEKLLERIKAEKARLDDSGKTQQSRKPKKK